MTLWQLGKREKIADGEIRKILYLFVFFHRERWMVWERQRGQEKAEREGERQMSHLLVKAWNCPIRWPFIYQEGGNTYSSFYSLSAASVCFSLMPSSGSPATGSPMLLFNCHTEHTDTHTCTPHHLTSMNLSPIRIHRWGDAAFARACQMDLTLPNILIISCPSNQHRRGRTGREGT